MKKGTSVTQRQFLNAVLPFNALCLRIFELRTEKTQRLNLFEGDASPVRTIKAVKLTHGINTEAYISQHQGLHDDYRCLRTEPGWLFV